MLEVTGRESLKTLTVQETARLLRIGKNQAYQSVREGRIPSISLGKTIRVPVAALERMMIGGSVK